MTTATTPPMRAWSIFCGAPSPALESGSREVCGEWSHETETLLFFFFSVRKKVVPAMEPLECEM